MVGKANYGEKEVRENLLMGAVEILLVSKGINLIRVKVKCQNCEYKENKTLKPAEVESYKSILQKQQCPQCNVIKWEVEQKDLIMDLGDLAENTGATIEIISPQTEEGRQIQSFGGICAILRYIPS